MAEVFAAGVARFRSDATFPDRCRRQAESFTWRTAAEKYADVYAAICR
jgi:glycosyltransferase involved in cell wall biosynthesis